jgi:Outer membrane protein beta-barrel domain
MVTVLIAAFMAATSTAYSQSAVQLGVGGGVTIPAGMFRDAYNPKENVMVSVSAGPQASPLGVRVDYSYNEFGGRHNAGGTSNDLHLNIITGDFILASPVGLVKPYVVAGGGYYRFRDAVDLNSSNDFGVNAGVGCTFPMRSTVGFVEARYHRIFAKSVSEQLVPVSVGILF